MYELGPEPPPDDIDGRSPSVVTWQDGDMFYLVASSTLSSDDLVRVAVSLSEAQAVWRPVRETFPP